MLYYSKITRLILFMSSSMHNVGRGKMEAGQLKTVENTGVNKPF
jgi:hypothetical protein